VFSRALRWSISWGRWIKSILRHLISVRLILLLSSHLILFLSTGLIHSGVHTETLYAFLFSSCVLHVSPISFTDSDAALWRILTFHIPIFYLLYKINVVFSFAFHGHLKFTLIETSNSWHKRSEPGRIMHSLWYYLTPNMLWGFTTAREQWWNLTSDNKIAHQTYQIQNSTEHIIKPTRAHSHTLACT
jgi:hypothetical protein